MCLLDRLLAVNKASVEVSLKVRPDDLFASEGAVPAWVGLEYMAQAVAAWSGYHCLRQGKPIRIGLLLGTREYCSEVSEFGCGTILTVQSRLVFEAANEMRVFDCQVRGHQVLASAQLNVLLPQDIEPYLRKEPRQS